MMDAGRATALSALKAARTHLAWVWKELPCHPDTHTHTSSAQRVSFTIWTWGQQAGNQSDLQITLTDGNESELLKEGEGLRKGLGRGGCVGAWWGAAG